jgi:hypothetical protein
MKFKLAVLASAVAMAVAGQASAALTNGASTGNGDLFFTAWTTEGTIASATVALGQRLNDYLPSTFAYPAVASLAGDPTSGSKTPDAGFTQTFNVGSVFNSIFSNSQGFFWNIVAGDQTFQGGNGIRRAIFTGTDPLGLTNNGLQTLTQNVQNFSAAVDSGVPGPTSGLGYGGDASWGTKLGLAPSAALDTAVAGFGSTGFWYIGTSSTNALNQAYRIQYANSTGNATWTLEADGDLIYNIAGGVVVEPPVPEIPIPAAGWLLLSGLLSLGAVARRRIAAQ